MMIEKDIQDIVLDDFLEAYEVEDLEKEDLEKEDLEEEDLEEEDLEEEQQFNVYNLHSTVVQSTSSFMDSALDDLPVLDICCLFVFAVCVFFLFNIFSGGDNNVRFD